MRITLHIDIETKDIPQLQKFVAEQPEVKLIFADDRQIYWGRFVGAREAHGILEMSPRGET